MSTLVRGDVPIAIQNDNVELRMTEVGEMTVSFISLKEGTDLGPAFVGLPDDLCPCPHWGYMIKGRVRMHTPDGHQDFAAGGVGIGQGDAGVAQDQLADLVGMRGTARFDDGQAPVALSGLHQVAQVDPGVRERRDLQRRAAFGLAGHLVEQAGADEGCAICLGPVN